MKALPFALALFAAVCWGAAAVMEKVALVKLSPMAAVLLRGVSISFAAAVVMGASGKLGEFRQLSAGMIAFMSAAGVLSAVVGQSMYYFAMKGAPVGKIVPIVGCYPLFAAVFAVIFLGESLKPGNLFGILLIIAGIALVKM